MLLAYMHHMEVRLHPDFQRNLHFWAHPPTNCHASGTLQVFTPAMPQEYNLAAFRADLKAVMLRTGVERRPTCLFLEDHQLGDPAFLECINSLLSGGEVSTAALVFRRGWPASQRPACVCFLSGFASLSSSWGSLSSLSHWLAQLRIRVTG